MFRDLRIEGGGEGEVIGGGRVDIKVTEFKLHVKQTAGSFERLESEVGAS